MKRRFICFLMSALLLLSILPYSALPAFAEDSLSGVCGDNLTWSFNPDTGALTIEGSGAMEDYRFSGYAPWYSYRNAIRSLSLPYGLTGIGNLAFYGCKSLTTVDFPESVTRIGEYAFYRCSGLTDVVLPAGLTTLELRVFNDCTQLRSVVLPAGLSAIQNEAFLGCSKLSQVDLSGTSVTSIGDQAFLSCKSLTAMNLPASLTSIGYRAFSICPSLTAFSVPADNPSFSTDSRGVLLNKAQTALIQYPIGNPASSYLMPDSVVTVREYAFENSKNLLSVHFAANLTDIGDFAFFGCSNFSSVVLPAGLRSIGGKAFSQCSSMTSINFPASLTTIGASAFMSCGSLTAADLSETSVTSIELYTFLYCGNLTELSLPECLTTVGKEAFYGSPLLTSVTLPAGLTRIGDSAFGYITGFETSSSSPVENFTIYGYSGTAAETYASDNGFLFVPLDAPGVEPVTGVCGDNLTWSFDAETGLLTINGSGDMWDFDEYFEYDDDYGYEPLFAPWHSFNDSILALSLPEGLSSIGNSAFQNCFALEEVHVPEGVTRIGASAFASCSSLSHLELPIGLEIIDSRSFENCASLTGVELPEGLSELGHSAFSLCCGLSSIGFPDSLRVIGPFAFYGCGLTELSFPAGLTSIGDVAFGCCDNLTAAIIPAGLTSFGEQPFFACDGIDAFAVAEGNTCFRVDEAGVLFNASMTQLLEYPSGRSGAYEIPEGVVSVANRAFDLCKLLTGIRFPDSLTSIGDSSFLNCSGLTELMFPANLTEVGDWAFRNCTGLTAVSFPGSLQSVGYKAFLFCPELIDLYYGGSAAAWAALKVDLAAQRKHYNVGNPADHWVSDDQLPTCTEDGLHRASCPCGYEIEPAPIPAFGHDFADGVCTRCGKLMTAADIFSDVDENAYYAPAVLWAAQNGITSGTGNGTFSPKLTCTREQIVTFLWNAAGKPAPAIAECRFSDVVSGRYYYDAVLWAVENGITNGVSSTSFGVGRSCTREQLVTFLWNAAGKPEPMNTECPFSDVARGKYYYIPVLWAYENGITAGIGEGAFGVGKSCTRAEAVTFLYTAYHP